MNLLKELSGNEKYIVRLKVATRKYDVIDDYIKLLLMSRKKKR